MSSAYWARPRPMAPRFGAEAGTQLRHAVWQAASRITAQGAARDRLIVATIRNNYPKAAAALPDIALVAAARELGSGACSWCALVVEAATSREPLPRPSPTLNALLGSRCGRCKVRFRALVVADRERAMLATGQRRPAAPPTPTPASKPSLPAFYGSRRLQPGSRR